jgi:PPOX class probable F420-dependent enzyme
VARVRDAVDGPQRGEPAFLRAPGPVDEAPSLEPRNGVGQAYPYIHVVPSRFAGRAYPGPSMGAANLRELPGWARHLLEGSPVGRLAYLDDRDRPRVLPVTYAVAGDAVWTAIDRKPKDRPPDRIARVRYLRRRPEAALCVDHYEDDWDRLAWMQVIGTVSVLARAAADEDPRAGLDALVLKYAAYRSDPPEGPLLALRPERIVCWRAVEGDDA